MNAKMPLAIKREFLVYGRLVLGEEPEFGPRSSAFNPTDHILNLPSLRCRFDAALRVVVEWLAANSLKCRRCGLDLNFAGACTARPTEEILRPRCPKTSSDSKRAPNPVETIVTVPQRRKFGDMGIARSPGSGRSRSQCVLTQAPVKSFLISPRSNRRPIVTWQQESHLDAKIEVHEPNLDLAAESLAQSPQAKDAHPVDRQRRCSAYVPTFTATSFQSGDGQRRSVRDKAADLRVPTVAGIAADLRKSTAFCALSIADKWEPGSFVELTKLRATPGAEAQPGNWDDYPIGSRHSGTSLPVDYVLVGILVQPPEVGRRVVVFRTSRNDVQALGVFESTEVVELVPDGFMTRNSVYRMRRL